MQRDKNTSTVRLIKVITAICPLVAAPHIKYCIFLHLGRVEGLCLAALFDNTQHDFSIRWHFFFKSLTKKLISKDLVSFKVDSKKNLQHMKMGGGHP